MLLLSRRVNESVMIQVPPSTEWTTIAICVTELRPDRARLGCVAPKEVVIDREEIYLEKRKEGRAK